ncbi:helix-turn-helix domain-containing protein [Plantactinospora solaniradicis]|uniref:Helix-turn-helix domain-containing protein n=1 Tax=Plantactinospora solaniradicis TaxID=1723736 RepID=A0ABW1K821_9ACTN
MHARGAHTVDQIAAHLGVSRATVYRHLRGGAVPTSPVNNETVLTLIRDDFETPGPGSRVRPSGPAGPGRAAETPPDGWP